MRSTGSIQVLCPFNENLGASAARCHFINNVGSRFKFWFEGREFFK